MKYTTEIEINKPIDEVVALFDDPDNMDKWMEGLQCFEPISDTPITLVGNMPGIALFDMSLSQAAETTKKLKSDKSDVRNSPRSLRNSCLDHRGGSSLSTEG